MIGMRRRYVLTPLLALVAALASGCAVGNTHTFRYEPGGRRLASNRIQGKEELSGAPGRQVPPFFYDLMRQLVVGDPEMVEALTQPIDALEPVPADRTCTVEQILEMRDAGLTDEQIRAACGEGPPE